MFLKHGISALEEKAQKKGQNLELLLHAISQKKMCTLFKRLSKVFGWKDFAWVFERDKANFVAIAVAYGEKFNEVEAKKTAKASIEKTLDSLSK